MNNPFSQPKVTHKIRFITNHKSIELFENFFPEDTPGISICEVESVTIDPQDNDLWSFEVYLAFKPDLKSLRDELTIYANENGALLASKITAELIEDKDWVTEYQKQLKPIEIGRFIITSSVQKTTYPKDKIPIFIEASRAFGTGDHATTSLCIEAMKLLEKFNFKNIFDVGTGSGILGFTAEKIWLKANILACDIDEVSVKIAKDNLSYNNSKIQFYQNTENNLNIPSFWKQKFDLIVSNILAKPLISLAQIFKNLSHPETRVILSGFLDYQENEIIDAYQLAGFVVENSLYQEKWVTLTLKVKES